MLKISYAGCPDPFLVISAQFFLETCSAAVSCKITLKPLLLEKGRGSRSFKVIDVGTAKKLVTSACYDKQHVCTCLQQFSRYKSQ